MSAIFFINLNSLKNTHPTISVLTLLCFAAYVAFADYIQLFIATLMLISLLVILKIKLSAQVWRMLLRLRVLLISMALIYFWLTPGDLIFPILGEISPTIEGVLLGVARIYALILLVVASHLLCSTPRSYLLAGLYYLIPPIDSSVMSRQRMVARVILTMEAIFDEKHQLAESATEPNQANGQSANESPRHKIQRLSDSIQQRFDSITTTQYPPRTIDFIPWDAPSLIQWIALMTWISLLLITSP